MKHLKANFHLHTAGDPEDWISYSEAQLIDRAAELNYEVLAITCHNKVVFSDDLAKYAAKKGIVLIPGIERSIEGGKHLLIINASQEAEKIMTFDDLRAYKKDNDCFTIAAHPCFPMPGICMGKEMLLNNLDVIDGIEYSYYHSWGINFNKPAEKIAAEHNKPLIGNADCHLLPYLNTTYSLLEGEKSLQGVLASMRAQKVQVKTRALSPFSLAFITPWLIGKYHIKKFAEKMGFNLTSEEFTKTNITKDTFTKASPEIEKA